ncbi:MAG TPA: hypothetical protein IAA21_06855 [Candidatus Blautia faecigallinarum]|uniref:Uncharacterized protein n=1 Tax=Candidatus Blautia faecigallinarum TaxID=2838488 RepID=A0A9D2ITR6_9FIRM|nr:hypothetical protein [Candidatus Blautia faecigallinarum]
MGNINPPVHQIYLVGPEKQGKGIAREIFPYCKACDWIPAFFVAGKYTDEMERRICQGRVRTGVIAFGDDSERVYERLQGEEPYGGDRPYKVMRLLKPGETKTFSFFSYQAQIWAYPKSEQDFHNIASWLGFVSYLKEGTFRAIYPGALNIQELFWDIDLDAILKKHKEQEVTHS